MDCIVHGVAKSWARLSDFHFTSGGRAPSCRFTDEQSIEAKCLALCYLTSKWLNWPHSFFVCVFPLDSVAFLHGRAFHHIFQAI